MDKSKLMLDFQYLDNNYQRFYFIPWPDCQYFDDIGDDDRVIPVCLQSMVGSFIDPELIEELADEKEE